MALIRFALILFITYLVFRILGRYLLPVLLKYFMKRTQNRFYEQNPHLRKEDTKTTTGKEGEIHFEKPNKKKSRKINPDVGEYTDFEEVSDEPE